MSLVTGSRLGPYEVLSQIGAGGMGEVYRARDTKLGRDVAIKVLPEAFARDPSRMARFSREAKLLAALDHPNIASIYGLEDSGAEASGRALVMQLAEGPTLADRLRQGPLPIEDVLKIARQLTDALEYAHEKGIIHRDLKPANIKVAADDSVKILDFGLAKAMDTELSAAEIANSPTMSHLATQAGVLLGTAAYMSPEQAKAKPVDRRADIWAFGCVVFEMLTGKTAFSGETVTDTLAAVITKEPDWSQLPASTPMRVRVLLQRCLQKDPKRRLRDIGDARISLDEVVTGAPEAASTAGVSPAPMWRRAMPWAAGVLAVAITGAAVWNLRPVPAKPVTRFTITLSPGERLAGLGQPALALSPDGSHLAYVASRGGTQEIFLRAMDREQADPVAGTEGATDPFFSPDGQWLGFFAGGRLKKISVSGGAALTLADAPLQHGATWGRQGRIAFAPLVAGPLQQVSDTGGTMWPLTRLGKGEVVHGWPEFLPGGEGMLFVGSANNVLWSRSEVAVLSTRSAERRDLIQGTHPRYVPSGHLVYGQGGNLMAVAFDLQHLEVKGGAVPVVEGVLQSPTNGAAQYAISPTGTLVYLLGGAQSTQYRMVWVDRTGAEQTLPAPTRPYRFPRVSPDGQRVALTIDESESHTWLYDLRRETLTRWTFDGTINLLGAWTPDGKRIAFQSDRQGQINLYWQLADGGGGLERLTTSDMINAPNSFSPDGKALAFIEINPDTGYDILVLRLGDRSTQPFLRTKFNESAPRFSPDGRWLAYVSDESGRMEVYVQSYPGPGGKWQISMEGGTEPVWNPKGRELFYRSGDRIMAVDITTQPGFGAGKPRMLFEGPYQPSPATFPDYDVSPDGQRFLMLKPVEQERAAPTQINVVLNWTEELKRLVPSGSK